MIFGAIVNVILKVIAGLYNLCYFLSNEFYDIYSSRDISYAPY